MPYYRVVLIPLLLVTVLVGCRADNTPVSVEDLNIQLDFDPAPPAVGDSTAIVTLTDNDGNPVNDADITLRGDMTHAGMIPVIREIDTPDEGVYTTEYSWSMGGDWFVDVTVVLPNGETAIERFEYNVAGDMDDMEMADDGTMEMDAETTPETATNADDMNMGSGATTGAYMSIHNNDDMNDITLVSVQSDVANVIELHETVVADDIARMREREDGIVIPAGEVTVLRPGGLHMMLMGVQDDLVAGDMITLTLTFADDTEISVEVQVADTAPDDATEQIFGELLISDAWVRPTAMSARGDMGMDTNDNAQSQDED